MFWPLWRNGDSILENRALLGKLLRLTSDSALRVHVPPSTALAASFGTDPYLGNEIVCCAWDEENDLKCF